jgi:hypothetical protein
MDWADKKAAEIVDEPGVLHVWPKAGYCRKCNQPISASALCLTKLKARIAEALRDSEGKW